MLELRQVFNLKTTLVAFRLSPLQHEINQNTRLELCQVFNIKRNSKMIDVKVYIGIYTKFVFNESKVGHLCQKSDTALILSRY